MQDRKIYNCLFSQRGKIVLISSFFFFVVFPVKRKVNDNKKALFLFSYQKKSLVHEKIYMKMRVFNFKEVFQTYFPYFSKFNFSIINSFVWINLNVAEINMYMVTCSCDSETRRSYRNEKRGDGGVCLP